MLRRFAPLRARLPMTVALLLAVSTGVVVTMAYRAVRASVTSATTDRLHGGAQRIATLLDASVQRLQADGQRILRDTSVNRWIHGGDSVGALAQADSIQRSNPQNTAVVLTRPDGRSVAVGSAESVRHAAQAPAHGPGPFFSVGDRAAYSFTTPLLAGRDTVARMIVVRTMAPAGNGAELLGGLVGQAVTVLVGNADGSLWTELLPPERGPGSPAIGATSPDTISSTVRMAGAPWLVKVQQPASIALEPATTLVRRLVLLAIVAVLIGAALAWWIILRFTAPLDQLASTSDALAHGDYSRRIARATARDEVGRAAIAFNTMAAQIESHHRDLESQVRERTAELERALEDLHAAQREIVRTEKLAMLGQLAGGVGHELRNPLGVMTNSLYVLETVIPEPGEMVRDYFGILKNQIALCEKIVADLLDFARTKHPTRTPVALSAIARQQLGRLGLLGRVEIGEDVPDTLPLVNVDAVQIGQVVFNLLTNAIQAMGERGGALRLRGFSDGNGQAVLEVTDSGPGIPDDVAARLFEPLFTTKTKGLGLGLCVSRTLAESNGGSLTFRTRVGVGTTFALSLPVAPHA